MRSAALEELDSELMQSLGEVDGTGTLPHAVHPVVGRQGLAVHPQFRTVVRVDEERPVSGVRHIDKAAEASTPIVLEAIVKTGIGVVGGPPVQVRLDLDAVGLPVDERRHAGGAETHAVVVEILAVDALHAFATVLVAIGPKAGLKRPVPSLLGVGLVRPGEVVLGCDRR